MFTAATPRHNGCTMALSEQRLYGFEHGFCGRY